MRIVILGDICITGNKEIQVDRELLDLLSGSDILVGNYEGPLDDGKEHCLKKSGPRIKQTGASIKLISELNINVLCLANNHMMDDGQEGLKYSVISLEKSDIIGAGNWSKAYSPLIKEISGVKIGILNATEMQFGMLSDKWKQSGETKGCAWVNHPCFNNLIIESKKQVDCLIAIIHAGVENIDMPLPEWRDRYRELIDLGCDAVIAHHPHVIQGYEIYKDKPICYSLGNFCFPNHNRLDEKWNTGAIAILELDKGKVVVKLHGCQLKDNTLKKLDEDYWNIYLKQQCFYLRDDIYMKVVDEQCKKLLNVYWKLFAMGGMFNPKHLSVKNIGRIILGKYDLIHTLNNFQCESHRWCISRALRNEIGL